MLVKNQFSKLNHDKKKCDNIQQLKNINRGLKDSSYNENSNPFK